MDFELQDDFSQDRKRILDSFDRELSEIEDGIEAFYHRVHNYIKKKADPNPLSGNKPYSKATRPAFPWELAQNLFATITLCLLSLGFGMAAKLDVEGRDLTAQDVRLFGGLVERGVLVTESHGNAKAAGIQKNDVVVGVNGAASTASSTWKRSSAPSAALSSSSRSNAWNAADCSRSKISSSRSRAPSTCRSRKPSPSTSAPRLTCSAGSYQGRAALLWHANGVLTYSRILDKEDIVSLLKVYSIAEHQVYRYVVPDNVVESRFLTDDGLLLYVSSFVDSTKIGIVDVNTGERRLEWTLEMPALNKKPYHLVMEDINGDDIPELFYSFDETITCIDGITGNVVWVRDSPKDLLHGRAPHRRP